MTDIKTFSVDQRHLHAPAYEWEVLWHMLFNLPVEQLPSFIASIDTDLFTDRAVGPLVRRAKKLLDKTSVFTIRELLAFIQEDGAEGVNVADALALLESHGALSRTMGIDKVMSVLAEYAVRRKAVLGVEQMLKGFDNGHSLAEQQAKGGVDIGALLNDDKLVEMATGSATTNVVNFNAQMIEAMKKLEQPDRMMSVGIEPWDRMIGGLFPGEYYLIHGPSGVTKTGMMVNLAYNVAASGRPVVYFTCEENEERIIWRLWSKVAGIPFGRIKKRDLSPSDWGKLHDASTKLADMPLEIVDANGWTARQIREYCEKNGPHAAIYIDSFAFVNWGVHEIYERAAVGGKFFKALAHDLDAAVVAICHNSTRGSREEMPTMFNVEGGEGLTRPAWVCLELRLDSEEIALAPGLTNVRGYLTKNRDGPPKQYMNLQWDALTCTYSERIQMKAPAHEPSRQNMDIRPRQTRPQDGVYRARRGESE